MIQTRPVRTDSKKFKAAMARHIAAILAVLKRYNAAEDPDATYRYTLNTPAGSLRVHVSETSVFQRFDDLEMGRLASAAIAHDCNPSGKWNFGETEREILANPIEAMGYWERCIDRLMSIAYGWEPFSVRLQRWRESHG
jgi:hypothetical protein